MSATTACSESNTPSTLWTHFISASIASKYFWGGDLSTALFSSVCFSANLSINSPHLSRKLLISALMLAASLPASWLDDRSAAHFLILLILSSSDFIDAIFILHCSSCCVTFPCPEGEEFIPSNHFWQPSKINFKLLTSLNRHFFSCRKHILSLRSCRSAARPFHRDSTTLTLCSSSLIGSLSLSASSTRCFPRATTLSNSVLWFSTSVSMSLYVCSCSSTLRPSKVPCSLALLTDRAASM